VNFMFFPIAEFSRKHIPYTPYCTHFSGFCSLMVTQRIGLSTLRNTIAGSARGPDSVSAEGSAPI
jgi:hypothetical protein